MSKITLGKVLLTVTALYAGAGPYVFDWNKTHIHNPDWPPHAKFHNAQTMSLGAALSAAALTAIWGGAAGRKGVCRWPQVLRRCTGRRNCPRRPIPASR
ncbi:hypothetical protein P9139_02730 [Curtobacterium flaccumfaciens]|nr:hypothetical protein P9139_02730 [Curtobacterium flaccumfaciens]